ncbi:hypothetical protein ACHAQF_007746 [Verticillium nonalfalfae]
MTVTNNDYRQVRQGIANNTKGTAFVVYEDVMDAKQACDKLNGFNFQNRYLVVLYHQPEKMLNRTKEDLEARRESLAQLKKQHGPSSMSSPKTSAAAAAAASPSSKTAHRHDKLGVAGHVRRAVVRFADGGRSNALQPQTCA